MANLDDIVANVGDDFESDDPDSEAAQVDEMFDALGTAMDLSSWEIGFVSDIADQWERERFLTHAQRRKLEDIYGNKA